MEIVFYKISIASGDQREGLCARIGHVGRGVKPILKKEERAEDEAADLSLRREVDCQQKGNKPLQERSSPQAKRRTKPSKKIVPALVHNEVGGIDKEKAPMRGEGIE